MRATLLDKRAGGRGRQGEQENNGDKEDKGEFLNKSLPCLPLSSLSTLSLLHAQFPIPNPQSSIPNSQFPYPITL
ncbi:hypothetical protein FBB35_11130 [Nostoc sp. TCL240-02]|nr:hypothetical protein FBB35_11130 [Nostoc sp. TCL240-02]